MNLPLLMAAQDQDDIIIQLLEMGFSFDACSIALGETFGGGLAGAVDFLFSHPVLIVLYCDFCGSNFDVTKGNCCY